MAFRELSVVSIREILRRWKAGEGFRTVAAAVGTDRKTVRRYVEKAAELGFARADGRVLDDDLLAEVVSAVLPGASRDVGDAREACRKHRDKIEGWLKEGCRGPKIVRLLKAADVTVPLRTLNRFIQEELGHRREASTVRVVEPPPGRMLEIDFMSLGPVWLGAERVTLSALVCVASFSRHTFVWPCRGQTRQDVIDGLDAAWAFFGGVFPVVIADNPKALVTKADPCKPSINEAFLEYSQERGFVLDLARVRRPQDKPKVERTVPYARSDGFAGERFVDLDEARRHAETWCREVAGQRIHGTTRRRPVEAFEEERGLLQPVPEGPYDPPVWTDLLIGQDHAVTVEGALYSVPHTLRDKTLRVRADRKLVKFYDGGTVVKVHPRVARGASVIDPADLPPGKGPLATRDAEGLQQQAAGHGETVGRYAARLLEGPLPWTRMRHVYRLLDLCRRYGDTAAGEACQRALDVEVIDITRVQRMLEDPPPGSTATPAPPSPTRRGRFSRAAEDFRVSPPRREVTDAPS